MNKTIYQRTDRHTAVFRTPADRYRYWIRLVLLTACAMAFIYALLHYNNPVRPDSPSYVPIIRRRQNAVIAMLIASLCQSMATISFQSITRNRVITPSLLGFEAVYGLIQSSIIFLAGATALLQFSGRFAFFIQTGLMVLVCVILYGTLFSEKHSDLEWMLLAGMIFSQGLASVSSFMKRLLSPSEFDLLQAKLFGSVNNADPEQFPLAGLLAVSCALLLLFQSRRLNVLALGREVATNLGLSYTGELRKTLTLVAVLMAISTALVGPMTFFGFLVAVFTYELTPTGDHRYLFPMGFALATFVLTGGYFLMYHVLSAQGVVSILIEMLGGATFLVMIFRKGAR